MNLRISTEDAVRMGLVDGPAAGAGDGVGRGKRRGNKFGAKRTNCRGGHTHASGAEARRCDELKLLDQAGKVRGIAVQPVFFFTMDGRKLEDLRGRALRYTADFRYQELGRAGADGEPTWTDIVEDVKSVATMTEAATLRLALFRFFYPDLMLRITK